jgi:hypothetical protein
MSDTLRDPHDLQRQISQLRFTVIALLGCSLLFLALANLTLVMLAPRFEVTFEEMLGSKEKFPALTTFVLSYTRWFNDLTAFGVIVGLPAVCFALVLAFRRSIYPVLLSLAVLLVLIVHAPMVILAMLLPLAQIVIGIGERAP